MLGLFAAVVAGVLLEMIGQTLEICLQLIEWLLELALEAFLIACELLALGFSAMRWRFRLWRIKSRI